MPGICDGKYGHAVDRCPFGGVRSGVDDIVGSDDNGQIRLFEVVVDGLHLEELFVGYIHFGEQDVHVARHTTGYGVNGEAHLFAFALQAIRQLLDQRLGLRASHAIAWHNDDALRFLEPMSRMDFGA